MGSGLHNTHSKTHVVLANREDVGRRPAVGLRGGRNVSHTVAEKIAARTTKQPNGCWVVSGYPNRSGHQQVLVTPGVRIKVHIWAWQEAHGQTVPAGQVVRHRCHTPACINPEHLTIGTQHDNILDSVKAGRFSLWHHTGRRLDGRIAKPFLDGASPSQPQKRIVA